MDNQITKKNNMESHSLEIHRDSPRQVRATFVTKTYFQGSQKRTVCNRYQSILTISMHWLW